MKWTLTKDALPAKPGKKSYEHVECIVRMQSGETRILPWNCEHECWDDEDGDDFAFDATTPLAWIATENLPNMSEGAALKPEGYSSRYAALSAIHLGAHVTCEYGFSEQGFIPYARIPDKGNVAIAAAELCAEFGAWLSEIEHIAMAAGVAVDAESACLRFAKLLADRSATCKSDLFLLAFEEAATDQLGERYLYTWARKNGPSVVNDPKITGDVQGCSHL